MKQARIGSKVLMGLIALFFYLPIIYMIVFSFNGAKSLSKFTGFSLKWYGMMIQNHTMIEAIYYTVLVAIIATIVSTVIGTMASIGLSNSRKILKQIVNNINNLPIMNPEIVTAIGLMLFFTSIGVEKGFITMLLSHIAFCIPYVMLSVTPRLRRLDPNLADAAMDLGATPLYALWKVIIPELMPGIVAGALIAFTMSFDDFIISYFVTGNGVNNISILVYTMAKRVNPTINSLSTIIVVIITIVLISMNIFQKRKEKMSARGKKIGVAALCIVLILGLFGLNTLRTSSSSNFDPIAKYGSDTLDVFNTGEYIDEKTIETFETTYNVTVNYSMFASNEEMYTKLLGGENYDVLYPSDYMIQRLIDEKRLYKLDKSKIPNMKGLSDAVKNLPFDPDNVYSAPYFYGSVGIIYNKNKVSEEDLKNEGYNILKDSKYAGRMYLYDSERDSFMVALKALGYSMNTTNKDEINKAYEWLLDVKKNNDPVIVTDEVIDGMINGEEDLAVVYSGDATYITSENPDMVYYEPKEGTNVWCDSMVIPKNSDSKKLAELWINFNLSKKIAYNNSKYVGYTSPITSVKDKLENTEFKGISSYEPRSGYPLDESFSYNADIKKIMSELWVKVKAAK